MNELKEWIKSEPSRLYYLLGIAVLVIAPFVSVAIGALYVWIVR